MVKSTVVLTRYKEPNKIVHKSLESLSKQENIELEILFLDQFYNEDTKIFCKDISSKNIKFKYVKINPKGISYARNYGIKISKTKYIHMFDPDQIADKNWAIELIKTLKEHNCLVACGKTLPLWEKKPLIISKSVIIQELYSLKNYKEKIKEETVFFSGNVVFDKTIFNKVGLFNEKIGRFNGNLISGEDSELSYNILINKFKIIYNSNAFIYHLIPKNRISYKWVFKRLYFGGIGKAIRNRKPKPLGNKNIWDYIFLPIYAPPYFMGYFQIKFFKR